MGYSLIPLIASIVLAVHHVAIEDASRASKLSVVVVVAVSLVIWHYYPLWIVLATVLQVGASIYMLVYSKLQGV